MKEHAGGYVTTKSEQGPTVHSALHSLYWPVAIRVCLSFLCSFIQSTNTKAYPGFSTILGSRKSCKDKQGKTSALKQLTVSCAVNKKQKETECSMGRDRVNSGGMPGCPGYSCEVESEDDSEPLLLDWPLHWNMAKMPSTFGYISVCPANLFTLSHVGERVVERKKGGKVFVEIWRETRAAVMVGATCGLKVKPMVGRRGSHKVHIYMLAKKEKKLPLTQNKHRLAVGLCAIFLRIFGNTVNGLTAPLPWNLWGSQTRPCLDQKWRI